MSRFYHRTSAWYVCLIDDGTGHVTGTKEITYKFEHDGNKLTNGQMPVSAKSAIAGAFNKKRRANKISNAFHRDGIL